VKSGQDVAERQLRLEAQLASLPFEIGYAVKCLLSEVC
jgi:hypothetical protein